MSLTPKHIVLFADHVADYVAQFQRLHALSRSSPRLRRFLDHASRMLLQQIQGLTKCENVALGDWTDLLELSQTPTAQKEPTIGVVLTIAIQIGDLILLIEEDPSVLALAPHRGLPLGIGIGLLSACVAAAARDADDVVTLGLGIARVGFALALQLHRRAMMIEDAEGPWACTVADMSPAELQQGLDAFNRSSSSSSSSSNNNISKQVYAAIITSTWSLVCGPPSRLRNLSTDEDFAPKTELCEKRPLPACHSSHLPLVDVGNLAMNEFYFPSWSLASPVFSLKTCMPFECMDLQALVQQAVMEIAHQTQWVDETCTRIRASLEGGAELRVVSVGGRTAYTGLLEAALSDHCVQNDDRHGGEPMPQTSLRAENNDLEDDAVAIVGMAGRFPGCDDLDELWRLLEAGKTTHEEMPASRFAIDDFYDAGAAGKNTTQTRMGSFLRQPGHFDHAFFNISPREAMQMDPLQRLLLMVTYEALETAGYTSVGINSHSHSNSSIVDRAPRVAAYFGQTADDWKTINDQQGISTHYVPSVNRAFAPGRLNHFFGWKGPTYSVDTACSSSASCVCLARSALLNGECDAAVVGGGSLLAGPEWFSGLSRGGFLSPNGACKPFAETADGYCRAEGVGVVVLKRLSDARRDNDRVLAVLGAAERNSNAGDGSITHPSVPAQEALYRRLLVKGGLQPSDVDFVEMHGTGTQAGDPVEMKAVWSVFGRARVGGGAGALPVGAIKANLGHGEAVAGITSLIKAVLVLQHGRIPAQPGWPFPVNHRFAELLEKGIAIADGRLLSRSSRRRNIVVNSFDAAGGNVSLLVQDEPTTTTPPSASLLSSTPSQDLRSHYVVVCSGRSHSAHDANRRRLRDHLCQRPETRLADLAYTTTARRVLHQYRSAYAVVSIDDLIAKLNSPPVSLQPPLASKNDQRPPVVFAFTGQGSEYAGMGAQLYKTSPTFRRLLDSFQSLCHCQHPGQPPFIDIIRGGDSFDMDAASPTQIQLAVVALEIALARYWQSIGVQPSLVIGHSLGEYAALCIAGVLSVSDAFYLVNARARLLQDHAAPSAYAMLSLPLGGKEVQELLDTSCWKDRCHIACLNAPKMTVVGGKAEDVSSFKDDLASQRIEGTRLRIRYAFHTRQMDPLLDRFEQIASQAVFREPKVAVASTLLGEAVREGGAFNAAYLRRQMREPVDFVHAVRAAESAGLLPSSAFLLEVGPHPTCVRFVASSRRGEELLLAGQASLRRGRGDWEALSQSLVVAFNANVNIDWRELHRPYLSSVRLLELPAYAFDLRDFWASYQTCIADGQQRQASVAAQPSQKKLSTSLHTVESIKESVGCITATYISCVDDSDLFACIQGHIIDGTPLCPASIFIDMAYTAAADIASHIGQVKPGLRDMELFDLHMTSPLVVREKGSGLTVRTEATFTNTTRTVHVSFLSGVGTTEFGSCKVRLVDADAAASSDATQQATWMRAGDLIRARADSLEASAGLGNDTHHIRQDLVYRLFEDVVDYSRPFRGIAHIIAPADFHDAAARYRLCSSGGLGTFTCNPFAVDAIIQVSGFLLNAGVSKSKADMYIANRMGTLRVFDDALPVETECRGYARVRERNPKGTCLCDVYVFDGDRLVACVNDMQFQRLRKDVFAMLVHKPLTAEKRPAATQRQPAKSPGKDRAFQLTPAATMSMSRENHEEPCDALIAAVATQLGLAVDEIKAADNSTTFTDMGVDSQMSIAIIADYRRRTGVELPAAFFMDHPTPMDAEEALRSTYNSGETRRHGHEQDSMSAPKEQEVGSTIPRAIQADSSPTQCLLQLTADALGISVDDLSSDADFAMNGMDSMLSISILSSLQKKTGVELPAGFFLEYPTVGEATQALDETSSSSEASPFLHTPEDRSDVDKGDDATLDTPVASTRTSTSGELHSRAILIQGSPRSYHTPLFLATDGSGTVEAYIHLRPLPNGRPIYALESPFLQNPDEFTLTMEEMATIFIKSIREVQPHGPYLLGGWSAGGLYAYEIAHQLTQADERISGVLIMDMRVPSFLPSAIINRDFVERIGVFRRRDRAGNLLEDLTDLQKQHLMSTIRAVVKYQPRPFEEDRRPLRSFLIWATKGLNERSHGLDPRDVMDSMPAAMGQPEAETGLPQMTLQRYEAYSRSWFYGKRVHFGTNGWEKLLGPDISIHTIEGDHLSIVAPPDVRNLAKLVIEAVTMFEDAERTKRVGSLAL